MSWPARGIGTYDDTSGSPPLSVQLPVAANLVGRRGWVVIFLQPALPGEPNVTAYADKLRAAYSEDLRVIARLGWSGAMRDYADPGSNHTRYALVAQKLAALVGQLNACNEWRCTEPAGAVYNLSARAREVAGFMADTMASLVRLPAVREGRVWPAHASVASWQSDGCECGTNAPVGAGQLGTGFLAALSRERPALYRPVRWLSTHSYPFSNADYSTDSSSKAFRGLTYYRTERAVLNLSAAFPAAVTETGWNRASANNPVTEADQAAWMKRAADEIWAPDRSVIAVTPFLLGGRFWEADQHGWTFVRCPSGDATAPCDQNLTRLPVFAAWQEAGP
jgi:hypothetical protein